MDLITKFIAVAVVAVVLMGTVNFSTIAFAAKPTHPNCFGDSASDLAQSDEGMGEHSKKVVSQVMHLLTERMTMKNQDDRVTEM